jgi:chromosome segregation ATPase
MPPPSAAPNKAPLDALHAIKNEAARAAAMRMLLESNAADVAGRVAAHEAEVARRLALDLEGATPYGRAERVADQERHGALLAESDHVSRALADVDAQRANLSQQADEALAQRYAENLADLSTRITERVRRFFSLWKQVVVIVHDIEELCRQHRELQHALTALHRKQGQPSVLPREARMPRAVEEMHHAIAELAAPPETGVLAESWEERSASKGLSYAFPCGARERGTVTMHRGPRWHGHSCLCLLLHRQECLCHVTANPTPTWQ